MEMKILLKIVFILSLFLVNIFTCTSIYASDSVDKENILVFQCIKKREFHSLKSIRSSDNTLEIEKSRYQNSRKLSIAPLFYQDKSNPNEQSNFKFQTSLEFNEWSGYFELNGNTSAYSGLSYLMGPIYTSKQFKISKLESLIHLKQSLKRAQSEQVFISDFKELASLIVSLNIIHDELSEREKYAASLNDLLKQATVIRHSGSINRKIEESISILLTENQIQIEILRHQKTNSINFVRVKYQLSENLLDSINQEITSFFSPQNADSASFAIQSPMQLKIDSINAIFDEEKCRYDNIYDFSVKAGPVFTKGKSMDQQFGFGGALQLQFDFGSKMFNPCVSAKNRPIFDSDRQYITERNSRESPADSLLLRYRELITKSIFKINQEVKAGGINSISELIPLYSKYGYLISSKTRFSASEFENRLLMITSIEQTGMQHQFEKFISTEIEK